jgi:purine nucleosidase
MRKFWIDTDTASDDAVAILMALRWPDVVVEGISVVAGNVPAEMGSQNARYTAELCGRDIPVYVGALAPLLREPYWAFFFHGPDGMGGMNYPAAQRPAEDKNGIHALIDAVRAAPGEITLVTLGPLTNIAIALQLAPDIAQKIPMCYVMGGAACTVGNITPAAEYNIWFDPEAAQMVFQSGMPIFMVGWELCRGDANLSAEDQADVRAMGTQYADFTLDCNRTAIQTNKDWLGDPGLALPDPVTMAIALDPTICTSHAMHYVEIETKSELTRGMTVVDQRGVTNKPPMWMCVGQSMSGAGKKRCIKPSDDPIQCACP